jgi:uncharacterized FlgJ-related protein
MAYNAQFFADLMSSTGVPRAAIPFVVAQIAHESANFTSNLLDTHNNASGVTYNAKWQKNAQRGEALPENPNVYYAKFNSIQDWAKAYYHIIKRKINNPLEATDIEDYVTRLRSHNYFTDTVDNYLHGLNAWYNKYKGIVPSAGNAIVTLALLAGVFFLVRQITR